MALRALGTFFSLQYSVLTIHARIMKTNINTFIPQVNYRSTFTSIILVTLFLSFSAFQAPSPNQNLEESLSVIELEKDIEKYGKITWYLVKEIDPYQKETLTNSSMNAPSALILDNKNRFSMKGEDLKQYGYYELDQENSMLTLDCYQIGEKVLSRSQRTSYIYRLKSYGRSGMVLEWQGRHGKVKCYYVRIKRSGFDLNLNI